jgi:pimeloyl-ACP methyl ester carboxylesterase
VTGYDGLEVEVAQTGRGSVEYARAGSGPAVLLIHGTPGSWRQLVPLARDLVDRHTVLLPSRPGYGRTPSGSGRTPSEQAALYAALLDSLELREPVGVIGVSGGGPSALAFAQEHAARTDALALLCALAPHLMPIPLSVRVVAAMPPVATPFSALKRRRKRGILLDATRIDSQITRDLTADERMRLAAGSRLRDDLVDYLHSHAEAPAGLRGLANDAKQMHAARGRPQPADAVRAPTLLLHGDADSVVPITHMHHHASVMPHAKVEVFADAGHIFTLTRRAETTAAVRSHLAHE